jgi:hypothetical protein
LLIAVWGVAILVVGASLMAGHLVSLPVPRRTDQRLRASLTGTPGLARGRWSAHHVLYQSCGCSQRVLAHLLERQARSDLVETIVYVRDPSAPDPVALTKLVEQARLAGFGFEASTPVELERRYAGGYTERSGSKQIEDAVIIDGLEARHQVTVLPVFGCAVSSRVQQAIDPLGIKYGRPGT